VSLRSALAFLLIAATVGCWRPHNDELCKKEVQRDDALLPAHTTDDFVDNPLALAPLPSGRAYVVFRSAPTVASEGTELRGVAIGQDGRVLAGCRTTADEVLDAIQPSAAAPDLRGLASIAGPLPDADYGLITYASVAGADPLQVKGMLLGKTGCAGETTDQPPVPFLVASVDVSEDVDLPVAVPFLTNPRTEEFVVLWLTNTRATPILTTVRARAFGRGSQGIKPLATINSAAGDPVEVDVGSRSVQAIQAVALADREFVLVWYEWDLKIGRVRLQKFTDTLSPVGDPLTVDSDSDADPPLFDKTVLAAFDGSRLIVVWTKLEAGFWSVTARIFDANATPLTDPFFVGKGGSDELHPTVTTLPGGGFFLAWNRADGDGSGTGVRATALYPDGTARYQTVGCVEGEFTLNATIAGNQSWPNVAQLTTGSILALWNSQRVPGQIMTELRDTLVVPSNLFPYWRQP